VITSLFGHPSYGKYGKSAAHPFSYGNVKMQSLISFGLYHCSNGMKLITFKKREQSGVSFTGLQE
jgi:hypothetical protein